jgi:signal transduction histidine kinase
MRWTALGATLRRHHELIIAAAFVAMASYELLEMRALEPSRTSRLSLALCTPGRSWSSLSQHTPSCAHGEAMARLMEKVVAAQEDERRRLAYDLHDGVAQLVVSAKQHVDTVVDIIRVDGEQAAGELAVASQRLDQAIVETRRVLLALRPLPIDDGGLVAAARRSVEQASQEAGWRGRVPEPCG